MLDNIYKIYDKLNIRSKYREWGHPNLYGEQ